MVDHTSSQEELNAYWLEKNATSKWDQGHNHHVEPNDDERTWYGNCVECRRSKFDEIEAEIEFWDYPAWTEEQIRKAVGDCNLGLRRIHVDKIIEILKAGEE